MKRMSAPPSSTQGRDRVAQQVAGAGLVDPRPFDVGPHPLRQPRGHQRPAVTAEEQGTGIAAGDELDHQSGSRPVHVPYPQPRQLGAPDGRGVEHLQDRPVAQADGIADVRHSDLIIAVILIQHRLSLASHGQHFEQLAL